jgi:hypothetical protein
MSLIWQDYATEDRAIRLWRFQHKGLIRAFWVALALGVLAGWWAVGHVLWWIWKG